MGCDDVLRTMGLQASLELPEPLDPTAWGRDGQTWVFVYDGATASSLVQALADVRAFVNGQYWLPRPLRLRAPYMAVIGLVDLPDAALDQAVAESDVATGMGGESFHLVAATRATGRVVLPVPRGHRNQRVAWEKGLKMRRPDRYAQALLNP